MTTAKAIDEGVIHGGELITFRALPFPLPKSDQDALKSAAAAVKSGSVSHAVLERVEAEEGSHARTVWDMAQGLTAVARSIPNVEDRAEIETLAGNFWSKVAA